MEKETCHRCKGTGKSRFGTCGRCNGTGKIEKGTGLYSPGQSPVKPVRQQTR